MIKAPNISQSVYFDPPVVFLINKLKINFQFKSSLRKIVSNSAIEQRASRLLWEIMQNMFARRSHFCGFS